ncbi:hypothetical protein LLH23_05080 [bacterium]|nr:hypothetical protein [bacterium]
MTTPSWIAPGRLRWVWALWEPIELYMRGGYGAGIGDGRATGHWVRRWYERMHSDEILDQLAEAGVNLLTTHYYKGFGLQAEAAEMARAADFTRRAHRRGLRVLGYHQFSSVIYETMLDEVPHLRDWIQRAPDGSLRTYGGAPWRWMACPSHDDFIAYLKRVMTSCVVTHGLDGVEFDGTAYDCHCDNCQRLFRQYLTERHPEPLERFGLPHFRHVRIPPVWGAKDPLWQEWVRFRMQLMGDRLRELREYVHGLNPEAALVTYEDSPALHKRTRTRLLPDCGDTLDLAVAESHDMPQVLDGQLITKARHLQEGTAIGRLVLSTDWLRQAGGGTRLPSEARPVELDMAECLACGGHVLTATWALRSGDRRDGSAFFELPEFHQALRRFMGFGRDHEALYAGAAPAANVWVYHGLDALCFDHAHAYNSILGWEQALLGRIGFRMAKEHHLPELGARDVLVVANQTCLSDAECAALRAAVARGVKLVLTGATADCDEDFRQREQSPLTDLADHPRVRAFAVCPGATPQPEHEAGGWMRPVLPEQAERMRETVRKLAAEGLAVELAPPAEAYVDLYHTAGGVVAHVVHYGAGAPAGARLRVAPWLASGVALLHSPFCSAAVELRPDGDGWLSLPDDWGCYAAVEFAR